MPFILWPRTKQSRCGIPNLLCPNCLFIQFFSAFLPFNRDDACFSFWRVVILIQVKSPNEFKDFLNFFLSIEVCAITFNFLLNCFHNVHKWVRSHTDLSELSYDRRSVTAIAIVFVVVPSWIELQTEIELSSLYLYSCFEY